MERQPHNDTREAENRGRKTENKYNNKIKDARSENRIEKFITAKLKDPRERLQEIPLNQAKERRQKLIEENRLKKKAPRDEEESPKRWRRKPQEMKKKMKRKYSPPGTNKDD